MFTRLRKRLSPILGRDSATWVGWLRRAVRDRARWPWHALTAALNRCPKRLSVQLQTVSACNGRCVMCPYPASWHRAHPGSMSDALFGRILDQLAPWRLRKLCLYLQNEPFLDPKFIERLRAARECLRFDVLEVSTNASALTDAKAQALAEVLEGVPHEVWVSFHGVDREGYTQTMGLDFDRTLANVVGLLKLAAARGLNVVLRGAGAALSAGEAVSPRHFSRADMEAFWEGVFREHGIERRPELVWFAYHGRSGSLGRGRRRRLLLGSYCERIDQWLHVLYNGDVVLCCNDYHRRAVVGNLGEEELAAVLVSPRFRTLRLMAMGLHRSPPDFLCRLCTRSGG